MQTAILLIAHGSRNQAANNDLHELAERIARRGDYPIAVASFLEIAQPDIVAGGSLCVFRGAQRVLMVPYLLSAGVHLLRDLTAARDELGRRHPGVSFLLGECARAASAARCPGLRADHRVEEGQQAGVIDASGTPGRS